ncbi:MAG: chemotaxis protein CheD, partial [Gluconacetobacter diazotrophicus]|nr:chemotaxis protein CheD [Gluconacetobacter diazotrophicus]
LLGLGARRSRLQAKLFGGGRMLKGLTDVGAMNAAFAERFLADEGISYLGGSLRGDRARRIQFWPVSGRARQQLMAADEARVFDAERHRPRAPSDGAAGAVELF